MGSESAGTSVSLHTLPLGAAWVYGPCFYQKPRNHGCHVTQFGAAFPCLRGLKESRKWIVFGATRFTYIPFAEGLSLFTWVRAVVDLFSRHVDQLETSPSLDMEFLPWRPLENLLLPFGRKPQIFPLRFRVSVHLRLFVWAEAQDRGDQDQRSGRGLHDKHPGGETMEGHGPNMRRMYLRAYSDGLELKSACPDSYWRYCPCKTPIVIWVRKYSQ